MMDDATALRKQAIAAHGEAWRLLDKPDRSEGETAVMIGAAHRSHALWQRVGGVVEDQRGNWLVARCYIAAGIAEPALEFARRTLELTGKNAGTLADFDRAFAKEIAARAWALAGNHERALKHWAEARALSNAIAEPEERAEFFRQFDGEPWFGLERPA